MVIKSSRASTFGADGILAKEANSQPCVVVRIIRLLLLLLAHYNRYSATQEVLGNSLVVPDILACSHPPSSSLEVVVMAWFT